MTTPQYPGGGVATRPKSVDTSFMLWLAAAACGIISSLLNFATAGDMVSHSTADALRDAGMPEDQIGQMPGMEGAVTAGVIFGVIFTLILLGAWIALVFLMRDGKNWARIVLAVLGGIGILFGVLSLFGIGILISLGIFGILQALLSLAQLGLAIAAMIFMFKSDANAYFATPR